MPVLFGVFRLNHLQMVFSRRFISALYAGVIALLFSQASTRFNLRLELLQWIVLSLIQYWFAVMGSYISDLRHRLTEAA